MKLIAKPLLTIDKERKITTKEVGGKVYLMITPKRFIGVGRDLASAISNANAMTFNTGYQVEVEEA